jgi:hypothetical protein
MSAETTPRSAVFVAMDAFYDALFTRVCNDCAPAHLGLLLALDDSIHRAIDDEDEDETPSRTAEDKAKAIESDALSDEFHDALYADVADDAAGTQLSRLVELQIQTYEAMDKEQAS